MTSITTNPESSSTPWPKRVSIALADIKLAHSVFALPFAILATFIVAPRDPETRSFKLDQLAVQLILIIVCMVFARTWAMLVNRVADAKLDAENERTKRRAFASGALTKRDGYLLLTASALAFIITTIGFGAFFNNWLPLILSVPVLIWIGFYSFTKRFTFLCHVFLGGALAVSPLAAAIAINPDSIPNHPELYALAAMVLLWVAGFDIIYALQDLDHDQTANLNSIPAKFGWKSAIWIARLFHALALAALIMALTWSSDLSILFTIAVALTGALLIYEHMILAKRGKAGIPTAFFTLNGIISLTLGLLGSLDIILS